MLNFFMYAIGGILFLSTAVIVYNYFTAPKIINRTYKLQQNPLVSILIPARNEEDTIAELLHSILQQSYSHYELFVLDDQSDDQTCSVVESLSKKNQKINLLRGKPLPAGWVGKNWACSQLAQQASGKVLLFLDADVRLSAHALEAALYHMGKNEVVMLSCFPTQKIGSLGEWLIVPLMNWLLLSLLPLKAVSLPYKSLTAVNGQFILFDKSAYNAIGGHKAVFDQVVEDMEIARKFKEDKYRIMTLLGHDSITCTMYKGFKEAYRGFSKNFYPGFNVAPLTFICILAVLILVYFVPFILVFFNSHFIWLILIMLLGRFLVSLLSRQNPLINVLLHPLQMIAMFTIGVNSLYWTLKGKGVWKGRKI